MIQIPTLTTDTLTLRAPRMDDLRAYAEFAASPRTEIIGGPFNEAQAFDQLGEILGHWQLRGFGRWMVADKTTDEPLGVVGLFHPADWPEPEVAWKVFDAAEGRGVAHEAAVAARGYAYDTLGWHRVVSCISPYNDRSIALAKRMGCTREEDFAHPEYGPLQVWRHLGPEDVA